MKKALKWIGIVLGSLIGLIVVATAGTYFSFTSRFYKTYAITPDEELKAIWQYLQSLPVLETTTE